MKTIKHSCQLLAFLLIASCSTTKKATTVISSTTDYQTLIDSIYNKHPESVGIMVHLESPANGLSWSGGAGFSDVHSKIKLEPDQPALIASNIKTYIAATILRLQEQQLLTIEDATKDHLSDKTIELFESDGYNMENIKIKHLLSHTSGIEDYANDAYLDWIDKNQKHRWTRDEQLALAIKVGNPLGEPEDVFSYADANFLLCTEIMENVTKKPFYESMRELLKYKELNLTNTWFPTLEKENPTTKPLVHQYWDEKNWDSYEHDISWDLYGGGGIATTTEELAQFSHNLFNGKIIKDKDILNLIFTRLPTRDGQDLKYCLGLNEVEIIGKQGFGHGGFWGTIVAYLPEFDTSISVYILDRSEGKLRKNTLEALVRQLNKQLI